MSAQISGFSLGAVAVLFIAGCSDQSLPAITEYAHVRSPDGTVSAFAYEYGTEERGLTQVMLQFPGDCGAGSAAAYRSGLELELRWLDDENLQVLHPPGVEFQHNASGDVLRCFDRKVRVRLVARSE